MHKLKAAFLSLIVMCTYIVGSIAIPQTAVAEETAYAQPVALEVTNDIYFQPKPTVNPTGFDLRASLAFPTYLGVVGYEESMHLATGLGLDLQMVYRGGSYGVGVDQQVYGLFSIETERSKGAYLSGATYFIVKEYITIGDNGLFTFTEGIGAAYSEAELYGGARHAAFAFKFDLGFSYFIASRYGVGLTLEYTGLISSGVETEIVWSHIFTPLLTYQMIF